MHQKIDIAYQHLEDIYNLLLSEEFFIENRAIYIIKVRACEEEFKRLSADADKYTDEITEDAINELDRVRRTLCALNNYCLERISDNIVPERRLTLQPQILRWLRTIIDRRKNIK